MKTKKKSFKNKILVAAVCFGAIGTTGVQLANVASANAHEPRVWIGDVRDYRRLLERNGVTIFDNTYYKTLRCPHGYDELPATYYNGNGGATGTVHTWVYNYRVY